MKLTRIKSGSYNAIINGGSVSITRNDDGTWSISYGDYGTEDFWSDRTDSLGEAREYLERIQERENAGTKTF